MDIYSAESKVMDEIERLKRVEKAAQAVVNAFEQHYGVAIAINNLAAALEVSDE
jgi:hypothetical protein